MKPILKLKVPTLLLWDIQALPYLCIGNRPGMRRYYKKRANRITRHRIKELCKPGQWEEAGL